MQHYQTKFCKECKYYQGIKDLGYGELRMICGEFGSLGRGRIVSEDKLEALKYDCFELREKEEILDPKVTINLGVVSTTLNWKNFFRKICQKIVNKIRKNLIL